jgi:hopene-associated glycosyltransferase HpnB
MFALALSGAALLAWAGVLLLPWQPHRTRERLEPVPSGNSPEDLSYVTVLIPARDEAAIIGSTLTALARQGPNLRVIVIDDESKDGTAQACKELGTRLGDTPGGSGFSGDPARGSGFSRDPATSGAASFALAIDIVRGRPLPAGWGGKLWALEQGRERVATPFTLLLDADIVLAPGIVPALLLRARESDAELVSVMARLSTQGFWEKLLAPPFVFFFKLLYPFALANAPGTRNAAAAGGCLLVTTAALAEIGGFGAIRGALIDDCTLAARIKAKGHRLWLGLSHGVVSRRRYTRLADFWQMVSRTAFTQLKYSALVLLAVAAIMLAIFAGPIAAPFLDASPSVLLVSALALAAMAAAYVPVVRFYGLPWAWALTLPLAGLLFLAMTISSALSYWRGIRARWKSRSYAVMDE